MATADEYAAWIVKNSAKRGTPEFDTVAQAYQLAKGAKTTATFQQQNKPAPQQPGVMDQIVGAGETALTLSTGAVGGTLGTLAGTLQGLSQQILSGQFGTPEAMRAVEQAAAKGAQALTYQPRTQAGQEQVQAVGQVLANVLPPVLPAIAAPGAVMQAARTAAPTVGAVRQIGTAAGQRVATATGQAIARPVQAATTAVRETLGMETPAVATTAPAAGARVSSGASMTPVSLSETDTYLMAESPVGKVGGIKTPDGIKINYAEVDEASRGKGEGLKLYQSLIDPLLQKGKVVSSDFTVEAPAVRIYEALEKRGYKIERNIAGTLEDGSVYGPGARAPAFKIVGKPPTRASGGAAATPEVLRRTTTAEGLPVPVTLTKGAATRDAQQLAFEKEQIKSDLGGPLRQRAEENNLQALQNFDALVDMTDAQLMDLSSTGGAVVKSLTEGLTAAKNRTRAAYKAAEKAGELENNVTLNSVVDYINENIPEGDLAPVLKAAQQKAIAIGAAVPDADGRLVAQPVTLRQAESLRQTFQRAGFEGADQFHGGSLRRVFDVETEGMGGDLYKKARQTRIDQARKFENRAIVARLIKNRKGMEDPQVAADQVFRKSVLNSSPEEITFLKRVLVTSGKDGQQAWKELQGATVRHLRDETTKGMGMDSQDRPMISPAKLHQSVQALDANGRLDVLLGKKNAQTVRDLDDVVRYVTTVPPGTLVNSSGTAGTLLAAMAEAGATGALTGLPLPVASGLRQIIKMRQEGRTKARINEALNALPPVQP
jgi:hypothetical protein